MRTAHATLTANQTSIAPAANSSPSATGTQTADAFSMLIQALADATGQGVDASATDSSGGLPGAAPQIAQPGGFAMALQSSASDLQTKTTGKGDSSSAQNASTTLNPSGDTANGATPTDLSALAILAAAAQVAPVQPPAVDMARTSAGGSGASTGLATAGVGTVGTTVGTVGTLGTGLPADNAGQAGMQAKGSVPTFADGQAVQPQPKQAPSTATPSAGTVPNAVQAAGAVLQAVGSNLNLPLALKTLEPKGSKEPPSTAQSTSGASQGTGAKKTSAGQSALGGAAQVGDARGKSAGGAASDGLPPSPSHAEAGRGMAKSMSRGNGADQNNTAQSAAATQPVTDPGQALAAAADTEAASAGAPAAASAASTTIGFGGRVNAPASGTASHTLTLTPRSAALATSAVAQVNVMLQRAGLSGANSLTVQLDPAELGRVEVKLKMEKNGPVHASVTADRPQTLDMLRNDRGALERALQSAGLTTDSGSLSFNLRQNGNSGQQAGTFGQQSGRAGAADSSSTASAQLELVPTPNGWTESGRLDLRV